MLEFRPKARSRQGVSPVMMSRLLVSFDLNDFTIMRPFHEATKHGELSDFAGRKYVAKLKLCHQTTKNISIISLYGTTPTEMLLVDMIRNNLFLKFVAVSQRFKSYILQRNNELCMHNLLTTSTEKTGSSVALGLYSNRQGSF